MPLLPNVNGANKSYHYKSELLLFSWYMGEMGCLCSLHFLDIFVWTKIDQFPLIAQATLAVGLALFLPFPFTVS